MSNNVKARGVPIIGRKSSKFWLGDRDPTKPGHGLEIELQATPLEIANQFKQYLGHRIAQGQGLNIEMLALFIMAAEFQKVAEKRMSDLEKRIEKLENKPS